MRFVRDCDEMRMEYRWRDGGKGGLMDGGVHRGREGGLGRDGIIFYSAILRIASPIRMESGLSNRLV